MSRRQKFQFDREQLRITRGALILLFLEVGVSLVWLFIDPAAKLRMASWIVPTGDSVWREGKVWTLLTGPLLETRFISLLFQGVMLWMFVPALEKWVGTGRFLRFAVYTAVAGTVAGTLVGLATNGAVAITGLDPFIYASIIAFGIIYAKQPVQFFGVLPMTGRAFMWGMVAITAMFVVIGQEWTEGAAMAAAMLVGAGLASGKIDPIATWRRRKYEKARAHLSVVPPEVSTIPRRPKGDERYLN